MCRPLCVHLGLPKTATTTLQRSLFAKHSQIELLGKRVVRQTDPAHRRCSSDATFRLANQLFWEHVHATDREESRRIWAEEVLPAIGPGRLPLFSFEGLAAAPLETRCAIARNLRDVFEDCRVVIGIRRPVDLVEALYFQKLRRRHIENRGRTFERSQSPSPGQWLEAVVSGDELASHLDYARTIRVFVDALGRKNVGVFALEELKEDPRRFATELCLFLDIDVEEGVWQLADRRHNVRLSQAVADRMLRLERPGIASAIYARSGPSLRKRMLGITRRARSARARLPVPLAVRESIEDKTREGNRWIAHTFNLSLAEHGYPV